MTETDLAGCAETDFVDRSEIGIRHSIPGEHRNLVPERIPTTSKQPEVAKALIEWLASPKAYGAIKKSGLEPAKSSKAAAK